MILKINEKEFLESAFEVVERKGLGHPDTLSDHLAEKISSEYSKYTLEKYGAVLHHNFDKVGLLGGSSYVVFGDGYLTSPIRVLINGRASVSFGGEKIPLRRLITKWVKDFFSKSLPIIDIEDDIDITFNLSSKSSPGKTYEKEAKKGTRLFWFEPRSLEDLAELKKLTSNDTSLGVGFSPRTKLETIVYTIEQTLNSPEYKKKYPWLGTDIKILAYRTGDDFEITMCVPQISSFVQDIDNYKKNLAFVREKVLDLVSENGISLNKFKLSMNTRDNYDLCELYLTATGSSIESGDEGLVGRGNRINGLITPTRPMSMEGAAGKNPVYHIGKIYYVFAQKVSEKIYSKFHIQNEVFLCSQSGRDLLDPWISIVNVPSGFKEHTELVRFFEHEIKNISKVTEDIINNKFIIA
ncbi:MAG: methionine adenosyltransferase [bacterium]